MGRSGLAFRCAVLLADGVAAEEGGAVALDLHRARPLLENTGLKLQLVAAPAADPAFARRRVEALKRIHKEIERGRPAIVFGLHVPEWGLVTGFDDAAGLLAVRTPVSRQFGGRLPEGRWPVPERRDPLAVLLVHGERRVDAARACREALAFAVAYARDGDPGDQTAAAHGLAAFHLWAELFDGETRIDAAGNARAVQTVQTARREAALYLRGAAGTLAPAEPLLAAAAAYSAVALSLSRLASLFPYPGGGDTAGRGGRAFAAAALREAAAHEEEAVGQLAAALGGRRR
jgi:hypothetical protein